MTLEVWMILNDIGSLDDLEVRMTSGVWMTLKVWMTLEVWMTWKSG